MWVNVWIWHSLEPLGFSCFPTADWSSRFQRRVNCIYTQSRCGVRVFFFFFNTRFRARYPTESPLFPFVCIYSTLRLDTACLLACVTYRNNFVIDLSSYKKKAPPKESVVGSRWTHRDRAASPTLINSNDPRRWVVAMRDSGNTQ